MYREEEERRGRKEGRREEESRGQRIVLNYSNDVSCEFDEFRVDTDLCKLRTISIARL